MNLNYFNQAYYQNVPSSEVNWAELAQRWIMARPSAPIINNSNVPNFVFPPVPPPIEIRPPPILPGFSPGPQIAVNSVPPTSGFFGNGSAPLPPPFIGSGCFPPTNAFQQNTDNEEYKAHYDASLEQDDDQSSTNNNAPDGAMSHWFSGFESSTGAPSVGPSPEWMWNNAALIGTSHFAPIIDNQMRKRLPAWILEGLEKAEKEKQKKQKKEEEKRKQEEIEKLKEEKRKAKGRGKFDSDSESECEETTVSELNGKKNLEDGPIFLSKKNKSLNFKDNEPEEDNAELSLEERKQEALLAMRKLMTLVLLEATNNEIYNIAKECLLNAKRKARPKLLASSAALTALSAFGNDDEEDNDETRSHDSESDTEANNLKKHSNWVNSEKKENFTRKTDKLFNRENLTTILRPPTPETSASTSSTSSTEKKISSSESRHHSSTSSSTSRHHSNSSSRHSSKSSQFTSNNRHRSTGSSSRNSSSRHHKSSHRSRSPVSRKLSSRHSGNMSNSPSRSHFSSSKKKKS